MAVSAKRHRRTRLLAVQPDSAAERSSSVPQARCPLNGLLPIERQTHSTAAAAEQRAENCRRARIGRAIARLPFRIR